MLYVRPFIILFSHQNNFKDSSPVTFSQKNCHLAVIASFAIVWNWFNFSSMVSSSNDSSACVCTFLAFCHYVRAIHLSAHAFSTLSFHHGGCSNLFPVPSTTVDHALTCPILITISLPVVFEVWRKSLACANWFFLSPPICCMNSGYSCDTPKLSLCM